MSTTVELEGPGSHALVPQPIEIEDHRSGADRLFRGVVRTAGFSALLLLFLIGLFLFLRGYPALAKEGIHFFTRSGFQTLGNRVDYGVLAALVGTIEVATVAIVVGSPIAILVALFLSEYAPAWTRRPLIAMIDLAAAIPSIVFGLWAVYEFEGNVVGFSTWLSRHLGFIPFFNVTSPNLRSSLFIAGLVVGIMIVPIVASISREVFSLAPAGEREAALALGATRWQMIRTVVLPFGRGGMIGAVMLGLGRALEETIAVSLILASSASVSFHILQAGGSTISEFIATNFNAGGKLGLEDLLMMGFVLFALTLVINLIASAIVNRSRSGAGVDL
jgi:phosphate transport system permease protein